MHTIHRTSPSQKIRDHEFDFLKVPHEQAKQVTMMINKSLKMYSTVFIFRLVGKFQFLPVRVESLRRYSATPVNMNVTVNWR